MRDLNEHINDLCIKSKKMRSEAFDLEFDEAQKLRAEQTEIYKKYMFLKNIKKAIQKNERKEK